MHLKINLRSTLSSVAKTKVRATLGMSNLTGTQTGLGDIVVWVSTKGNSRHGPRIKMSNIKGKVSDANLFSMDIPTGLIRGPTNFSVLEIARILEWIRMNETVLLQYWSGTMSTQDMMENITKI